MLSAGEEVLLSSFLAMSRVIFFEGTSTVGLALASDFVGELILDDEAEEGLRRKLIGELASGFLTGE